MNQRGKWPAVVGVVLQAGPFAGLAGTVIGMLRAFEELRTASGEPDAAALSAHIQFALVATAIGLLFAFVGAVLILVALWGTRYRAPWFYGALWVVSVFWLLNFPIGTVLGVLVMVWLANHRREFMPGTATAEDAMQPRMKPTPPK
jgi:hypothetical protein